MTIFLRGQRHPVLDMDQTIFVRNPPPVQNRVQAEIEAEIEEATEVVTVGDLPEEGGDGFVAQARDAQSVRIRETETIDQFGPRVNRSIGSTRLNDRIVIVPNGIV